MGNICLQGASRWAGWLLGATGLVISMAAQAASPPRAPTLCLDDTDSCARFYRWYPSLDLATIPWHTASGASISRSSGNNTRRHCHQRC
jgi:hypothetical protein